MISQQTARCAPTQRKGPPTLMLLPTLEDALSEAFLAALRQWPTEGIPLKPEAWLMTAAHRRLVDSQRQQATASRAAFSLRQRFNPCTPEDCAQEQSRGQPSWRLALLDAMPTDRLANAPAMVGCTGFTVGRT
jgi:RNA polymerase sigma-70 factor, ECF subfamily